MSDRCPRGTGDRPVRSGRAWRAAREVGAILSLAWIAFPVGSLAALQGERADSARPEPRAPAADISFVGPPAPLEVLTPPRTPADIAREALPAVVEIVTYRRSGTRLAGGSGFIATPEGHVVTSHHVLEGAARAEVHLPNGDRFEVQHVTAADDRRDLAILRVAGYGLPTVRLGDARDLEAGDPVVVIGSPLGLTNTVSHGLVSARRDMEGKRLLQLSAPVSSGSSGGPVFDQHGRVVGILAGFMRRGQNVNFAVPVEYARGLLALPDHAFSVESVGRKRVALIGGTASEGRDLSLQALLRGESVPGEEETAWALHPRRVDADGVRARPATSPDQLTGLWELRELSRVPGTKSGLYRGVLVSDGTGASGSFFGTLIGDSEVDPEFAADRVRDFHLTVEPEGRATIHGSNDCSYYVEASPTAMSGVYECTDREGDVYDVGAVELRRIPGSGPSGLYDVREETTLGATTRRARGQLVLFALPDGRWLGTLRTAERSGPRLTELESGRWTADGFLRARLSRPPRRVASGSFEGERLRLEYPVGSREYSAEARLLGERRPRTAPEAYRPEAPHVRAPDLPFR